MSDFTNPVHFNLNKWYFWDEVWANAYGPFETKEECEIALKNIVRNSFEIIIFTIINGL